MTVRALLAVTVAVGMAVVQANSIPVAPLNVAALVEAADLIVVGQVVAVGQRGPATLETSVGSVSAVRFRGSLTIDRALKGSSATGVAFEFVLPAESLGFRGAVVGQYGILFLKAIGDHWEFADPLHPTLPAVPDGQALSGSALDQVTVVLGQVLTSPQASDSDRSQVLDTLGGLHTDLSTNILRQSLKASFGEQRLDIARTLVAGNDIAGLEVVENALLNPAGVSENVRLDLAGALSGLKDPRAIPALGRLVESPNPAVRRYTAMALRQTGSIEALLPLAQLLGDSDVTTRYYAVVGLGEISRQDDWAPAFDEFQQHQERYLTYWRRWAMDNLR